MLLPLLRARTLLFEPGKSRVLELRQRERGLRSFDAGTALIDALFDFVS